MRGMFACVLCGDVQMGDLPELYCAPCKYPLVEADPAVDGGALLPGGFEDTLVELFKRSFPAYDHLAKKPLPVKMYGKNGSIYIPGRGGKTKVAAKTEWTLVAREDDDDAPSP